MKEVIYGLREGCQSMWPQIGDKYLFSSGVHFRYRTSLRSAWGKNFDSNIGDLSSGVQQGGGSGQGGQMVGSAMAVRNGKAILVIGINLVFGKFIVLK